MANRKLSIGCVLIMGGALTNCGGTVDTRSDGGDEQGGAAGSGFVGVPPNGGFTGAVGTPVGAGSAPYGGSTSIGGYVGACCPGVPGIPGIGGGAHGGAAGTIGVGAGAGGYGNEGGWGYGGEVGAAGGDTNEGGAGYGGEVGIPPYGGAGGDG